MYKQYYASSKDKDLVGKLTDENHIERHKDKIPELYKFTLSEAKEDSIKRGREHFFTGWNDNAIVQNDLYGNSLDLIVYSKESPPEKECIWEPLVERKMRLDFIGDSDIVKYDFGYIDGKREKTTGDIKYVPEYNVNGYTMWQDIEFNPQILHGKLVGKSHLHLVDYYADRAYEQYKENKKEFIEKYDLINPPINILKGGLTRKATKEATKEELDEATESSIKQIQKIFKNRGENIDVLCESFQEQIESRQKLAALLKQERTTSSKEKERRAYNILIDICLSQIEELEEKLQ